MAAVRQNDVTVTPCKIRVYLYSATCRIYRLCGSVRHRQCWCSA